MADYKLEFTGDQVNEAIKEVYNDTVVKKIAQTFMDAEKKQIRENIDIEKEVLDFGSVSADSYTKLRNIALTINITNEKAKEIFSWCEDFLAGRTTNYKYVCSINYMCEGSSGTFAQYSKLYLHLYNVKKTESVYYLYFTTTVPAFQSQDEGYSYTFKVTVSVYEFQGVYTVDEAYLDGDIFTGDPYATCLMEGTLIEMADGSKKPIEEVKRGDMVAGYNPETNEKIATPVIVACRTGSQTAFQVYQFEDGNRIIIYGDHKYYNPVEGCAEILPNKDHFIALNDQLEEVECVGKRFYPTYTKRNNHYMIITNANTYFADGILCANGPQDKYLYFVNRGLEGRLPNEVKEIFKADADAVQATFDQSVDKEFLKTYAPLIGTYRKTYRKVEDEKKELAKKVEQKAGEKEIKALEDQIELDRKTYRDALTQIDTVRAAIPTKASIFATSVKNSLSTTPALAQYFSTLNGSSTEKDNKKEQSFTK